MGRGQGRRRELHPSESYGMTWCCIQMRHTSSVPCAYLEDLVGFLRRQVWQPRQQGPKVLVGLPPPFINPSGARLVVRQWIRGELSSIVHSR
jgi:hypothetical protein